MIQLSLIHYVYLGVIIAIITIMCFKKDVVLPCIIGLFLVGFIYSGSIMKSIQIIYRAILTSGRAFLEIVIIIALVNAMSKSLSSLGADVIMMNPLRKLMTNGKRAFFILGFTMLIFSWFIWPSPAVAFIGSLMVPAAIKSGLPEIWAAVALDLFGNGMALSSDYFIQGAPSITAKTAQISDPIGIIKASFPLWMVMSAVTVISSAIIMGRDLKKIKNIDKDEIENINKNSNFGSKFIAVITPIFFVIDVAVMYIFRLKGGDATALIGGTAVIIMCLTSLVNYKLKDAFGKVTLYIRDGAMFSMKVFAPVIIIGAFFFLGSNESAQEILGSNTNGFLTDIGMFISQRTNMSKISVILIHSVISGLLGIGGSGFSGLPLIGTLAEVFSSNVNIDRSSLAALGQVITIWVGGGTIIPWSVVPIAAICNVDPVEIVKKNIIPVLFGIIATILTAIFIL
ncbi:hypothetical protein CPAST_c32740 [Clostridium pasteurianum DSM 525 = ATCC 6013]|uniref:Transporter n=1 Tax=Clostridium pasteurianum DSM 525 = ATCC 6013 TaxID=1262449 RepID=A0A0H3JB95_CLOPA|nr:hypothetical protein [Clostridium pasteurianum]AJA49340.1 hypothetical protein CPAST_c32740 [Clostridium pasteurianum DSM 525 = ATCC 6013]AJA53328.1 hypothetical protein CLPA_c32740 [Clostridium pasteurianum DSM 525 = ATCC 6013]AOZ76514.1 hypothetical protein AQ983_15900 [Clostridium pasteurianum DSM 525 = ATCC 6013]AOZ80311.1 hypothetical protein AQ984_15895 [Clostridium pasteurianum]ELP58360.1 hypothetical protein F502_15375 [Clostridium pasteurianum DSM 525 = ATCC 6013]